MSSRPLAPLPDHELGPRAVVHELLQRCLLGRFRLRTAWGALSQQAPLRTRRRWEDVGETTIRIRRARKRDGSEGRPKKERERVISLCRRRGRWRSSRGSVTTTSSTHRGAEAARSRLLGAFELGSSPQVGRAQSSPSGPSD